MSSNEFIDYYPVINGCKNEAKEAVKEATIRLFFNAKCNNLTYQESMEVIETIYKGLHHGTNSIKKERLF